MLILALVLSSFRFWINLNPQMIVLAKLQPINTTNVLEITSLRLVWFEEKPHNTNEKHYLFIFNVLPYCNDILQT